MEVVQEGWDRGRGKGGREGGGRVRDEKRREMQC